jgi:hypothetical protein
LSAPQAFPGAEALRVDLTRAQLPALLFYGREARALLDLTPNLDTHTRREAMGALRALSTALTAAQPQPRDIAA